MDWPDSLELLHHGVLPPALDLLGEGTQGSLTLNFLPVLIPVVLNLIFTEDWTRSTDLPFPRACWWEAVSILGRAWQAGLVAGSGQPGKDPEEGPRSPGSTLTLFQAGSGPGPPGGRAFREFTVPVRSQGTQQGYRGNGPVMQIRMLRQGEQRLEVPQGCIHSFIHSAKWFLGVRK